MLDPFTALSVAGNVVQFVHFGCHLAATAHDVYSVSAGASEENLELETVTTRLLGTVRDLDDHLRSLNDSNPPGSISKSSKRLLEIANACKMVAQDILSRLEVIKLREPPSVWGSVRQAFKIVWTREELDALMKRLKAYVSELDTAILVSMKRNIDLENFRSSQNFYKLDNATQNIVDLLILNRSVFTSSLGLHTKEIKGVIVSEQAQTRAMILDLVQQKGLGQATSASFVQSTGKKEASLNKIDEKEAAVRRWVLDSLSFPAMRSRQEEVTQAYHTTFEWIFDKPRQETVSLPWTDFDGWLRYGENIYWINGKAGSGKSTLVKYIYNNRKTSEALSQWSGSMPILIATFFFWNGGTPEQRSQVGLLRSLLFQILQHLPALMPVLFPEENFMLQNNPKTYLQKYRKQSWSLSRLQEAIQRFVEIEDLPLKLCFLIDGLDEFEGNSDYNDCQHMIVLFRNLASSKFVKVCISSRPLVIFEESFKNCPGLRLQDLTSRDIRRYVVGKLSTDPRLRLVIGGESNQKHDLVREIYDKAQGVFLWVKLVVRSLLDGLDNSDHLADLRARLGMIPAGLEALYCHMVGKIDRLYLARTSRIFQMIRTARQLQDRDINNKQRTTPVTVLLLALALEDKPEISMHAVSEVWIADNLSHLCDVMRKRLQTWCGGLVEVPDFIWNRVDTLDANAAVRTKVTWEVAFLHRTARDFIEGELMWSTLVGYTANTSFDPHTSLLESTVLLYQLAGRLVNNPLGYGLFPNELLEPATDALLLAQRAEAINDVAYIRLLNELDTVMSHHLVRWTRPFDGHWSQFLDIGMPTSRSLAFLDVAIFYGLHRYVRGTIGRVQARRDDGPDLVKRHFQENLTKAGYIGDTNWLDMAVSSDCPGTETAQALLELGADPNARSGSQWLPIWEHILNRAKASPKSSTDARKWLQIMHLFIHHKVDMRGDQNKNKAARAKILDVLDGFKHVYPYEVASMSVIVNKKLGSKRKNLKMWTNEKLTRER